MKKKNFFINELILNLSESLKKSFQSQKKLGTKIKQLELILNETKKNIPNFYFESFFIKVNNLKIRIENLKNKIILIDNRIKDVEIQLVQIEKF